MEQLGKGLVLEPYLATVLLFGGLLQKGGSAELQGQYIPKIIDGSCLGAFAYLERQSRFELADVATRATASDSRLPARRRESRGVQRRQCRPAYCVRPHQRRAER